MTLSYATATRNQRLADITTAIGASGILAIYNGTPPANANTALSGNTQLAHLALSATFAGSPSGGVLTASTISTESSADASGTASFFRLNTSGGTCVLQGSVGASAADLILNTVTISAGAQVSVTSMTITEGNP